MKWRVVLVLHVLLHSSDEEVGVEVEAVGATWTLALHVLLVVNAQHGVPAIAGHHQLMPAALTDLHLADHRSRAGASVEPEQMGRQHVLYL